MYRVPCQLNGGQITIFKIYTKDVLSQPEHNKLTKVVEIKFSRTVNLTKALEAVQIKCVNLKINFLKTLIT